MPLSIAALRVHPDAHALSAREETAVVPVVRAVVILDSVAIDPPDPRDQILQELTRVPLSVRLAVPALSEETDLPQDDDERDSGIILSLMQQRGWDLDFTSTVSVALGDVYSNGSGRSVTVTMQNNVLRIRDCQTGQVSVLIDDIQAAQADFLDELESELLNLLVTKEARNAHAEATRYVRLMVLDGLRDTAEFKFARELAASIKMLAKGEIEPNMVADVRLRIEEILSRLDNRVRWEVLADLHYALSTRLHPAIAQRALTPRERYFGAAAIRDLLTAVRTSESDQAATTLAKPLVELDSLAHKDWHTDREARNRGLTALRELRGAVTANRVRERITSFVNPGVSGLDPRATEGHFAVPTAFRSSGRIGKMRKVLVPGFRSNH